MPTVPTLPGITSKMVDTPRIQTHVLFSGPEDGTPVLFLHGNAASSTCWEETMLMLPAGFRGIAPDLRGYGDTEDKVIDATRGMRDWVDDLLALMDTLGIGKPTWSAIRWAVQLPLHSWLLPVTGSRALLW